ncbi:MAG: DNA-directed RNA polymerase subunit alpha [Phycisphaerales bacterium]|nr:MAG: DNA-directed RNA polymerase subunit alpha [Phycisphaerales bacterium]
MPATLEEIARTIQGGDVDSAARLLSRTSASDANRAEHAYLRGLVAERRFDVAAAIEAYEEAIAADPHHQESLFRLAVLHDLRGDDEGAIGYYERFISQTPTPINALINAALLYEENRRYREADDCLRRVLEFDPNHARARLFKKHLESTIHMVCEDETTTRRRERDALLDMTVGEFELSVRSRNCLKQMNIHTLRDLLRISEAELLNYKNFGETSLNEIKAMLAQKGLRVGQLLEEPRQEEAAPPPAPAPAPLPGDSALLNRPVSELELSVRSRRCLQRLGITTLAELISRSETELLAIKNFGLTSLTEIKRELRERSLSLRGSKN